MRTGGIFPPRINKKAVITEELLLQKDIGDIERPAILKKKARSAFFPSPAKPGEEERAGEKARGSRLKGG